MSSSRETRRSPEAAPPPPAWLDAALAAACAMLGVLVQRRVLGAFFTPDGFVQLARGQGVMPWPGFGWRWISRTLVGRWTTSAFGTDPVPYHALNLAVFAACVVLLYAVARRWGASRAAACLAAGLFACARVHVTALLDTSWTSEFLALAGVLGACLAFGAGIARQAATVALVLVALLCKEGVLLVPGVLLLLPPAITGAPRRAAAVPLVAGVLAGGLLLSAARTSGMFSGGAYDMAPGGNVAVALFTLLRWAVDVVTAVPDRTTIADPAAWSVGLPVLVVLAATAWAVRRRAPYGVAGAAWIALALAPVLPLLHQTYLHYLVAPWAGLALLAAAALDAWRVPAAGRGRAAAERRALVLAGALVLAWAAVQERALAARWDARVPGTDTPLDPVLRKAELARRLVTETRDALGTRRARVAYLLLDGTQQARDLRTGATAAIDTASVGAFRHDVPMLLADGRNLRLFAPQVDSVVFVRRLEGSLEGYDCFLPDGESHLQYLGQPPMALQKLAGGLLASGLVPAALPFTTEAIRAYPGHPGLLWMHAVALNGSGDRAGGIAALRALVRAAPADSFATLARAALASEGLSP